MKLRLPVHDHSRIAWLGLAGALVFSITDASRALARPAWMQGGHAARISGVVFSTDGTIIASASDDGTIKLWSTNGALLRTLSTQPFAATAVAISPDGTKLAAGTYYGGFASGTVPYYGYSEPGLGLVYLWQAPSGWTADNVSLVRVRTNRYGKITGLAFSSDGTKLASGNAAGSNYVHQVNDGSVLATRGGYNTSVGPAAVTAIAFSTSGLLASGCEDKTLRVWNSSWVQVWTTNAPHTSNVTAIAFSSDGGLLASTGLDQTVRLWSTTNWSCLGTLTGHAGSITSVAFASGGNTLASGGEDGCIKLWDSASGNCMTTIVAHARAVTSVAFSPDGSQLVSGGEDGTLKMWSAADGTSVGALGAQAAHVTAVAISPDGTVCASSGDEQFIKVHHLADGRLLQTLPGHMGCVSAIAFSPDSTALAAGGGPLDSTIKLWRLSDSTLLRTIPAATNGVMALAFSPDGSMFASGGDSMEKVIQLWSVTDGSLLQTLAGHSNGVTALAFSPNGELLVSGGRRFDNSVKVWALTNSSLLHTFTGHSHNVESVAFSPDGDTVASGSSGANGLKVWQVGDGTSRPFGSETNPVFFVAFSPDGSTLASASRNAIKLWNVAAGALTQTITQEVFRVSCLAYSPNGNLIVYGRDDATLVGMTNALGALGQLPLEFTGITVNNNGQGMLEASVQPQTHYVIQSSTNLSDWIPFGNAASDTTLLRFTDSSKTNGSFRFYRAVTPP